MTQALLHPDTDAEFARIVDELTRRGFLAGGLGTAAVLGLAGCGNGTAPVAAPTTRVVKTTKGPVTVPADPQRVVCLDSYSSQIMLTLGITPAGVYNPAPSRSRPTSPRPMPRCPRSARTLR